MTGTLEVPVPPAVWEGRQISFTPRKYSTRHLESIGLADAAWVHQLAQGGGIIADAVRHSLLSTAQLSPATMLLRK